MFSLLHVNDGYGVYNYSLTTPMHSSSAEVYDVQSSRQGRPHDHWLRNDILFSHSHSILHLCHCSFLPFLSRSPPPPSSFFQTSWCVWVWQIYRRILAGTGGHCGSNCWRQHLYYWYSQCNHLYLLKPHPLSLFELLFYCLSSFLPSSYFAGGDIMTCTEKFGMAD